MIIKVLVGAATICWSSEAYVPGAKLMTLTLSLFVSARLIAAARLAMFVPGWLPLGTLNEVKRTRFSSASGYGENPARPRFSGRRLDWEEIIFSKKDRVTCQRKCGITGPTTMRLNLRPIQQVVGDGLTPAGQ
jgi:hypothetical protein